MYTSFRLCVRERSEKYFLLSVWRRELYGPGPRFFIIWQTWIYTRNLPVCNSGLYIYITGLCNFFFVLQDLIGRINSCLWRIAFQKNLLLMASNTLRPKFFPMKMSSLHWNAQRIIVKRNYTQSPVSIKCHNLHSFKEGVTLMSEYHWNKTNIIFTWLNSRYNPFKEINRIWKNYQNIRTIPSILGNGTLILLYSKVQNHLSRSDIPLYHSNSHNLVFWTRKHYEIKTVSFSAVVVHKSIQF